MCKNIEYGMRTKLIVASSLGCAYIVFELYVHRCRTKQIKKQKKVTPKTLSKSNFTALEKDILCSSGVERDDFLTTLKESFACDDNTLESLIVKLKENHPLRKQEHVHDTLHIPLPFCFRFSLV